MEYSQEELNSIIKKYKLTDEEYEEMYEKCKFVTFFNCTKCENPEAIFVGGQTGSGKGGIDVYSENVFLSKNIKAAVIDVDVYRALHPKTKEILNRYPTIYTNITANITGDIVKKILNYAMENRYSFIFEGTMRNVESYNTMKKMPDYFKKIVRVMAVPKKESLLTAFERNDEQINISGYGRFTNIETHNITYDGVLNTIRTIEEDDNGIEIEVFRRGENMTTPIKIFTTLNSYNTKPSEVIEEERNRKQSELTGKCYIDRLNNLLSNLRPKDKYEEEQLEKLIKEIKK